MNSEQLTKIVERAINDSLLFDWWVYLLVLILAGIGSFLGSYLRKKADNLATKEDISQITSQVESIKLDYSKNLEALKAVIGSQLYIHQTRYQNEFNILMDLSERLIELRDASLGLRPVTDYVNPEESEEEKKTRRLNRYHDAAIALYRVYETRKPFYPDEIYQGVKDLDKVVWKEVVQYKNRSDSEGRGFDPEYWDKAEANAFAIREVADAVIGLIRNRIKSWESFEFKK